MAAMGLPPSPPKQQNAKQEGASSDSLKKEELKSAMDELGVDTSEQRRLSRENYDEYQKFISDKQQSKRKESYEELKNFQKELDSKKKPLSPHIDKVKLITSSSSHPLLSISSRRRDIKARIEDSTTRREFQDLELILLSKLDTFLWRGFSTEGRKRRKKQCLSHHFLLLPSLRKILFLQDKGSTLLLCLTTLRDFQLREFRTSLKACLIQLMQFLNQTSYQLQAFIAPKVQFPFPSRSGVKLISTTQ